MRFPSLARTLTSCALAAGCAVHAAPTTKFLLSGAIDHPTVFDRPALEALPAVNQDRFVGTSLWGMLDSAGIRTNPAISNDANNRIVVARGSDGYRAVYALGELNPRFGNIQALVAYAEVVGGVTQPLGDDGFARTTAPGDVRRGRYVSNLSDVQLQRTVSTLAGSGGGISSSFSVTGDVLRPGSFDLSDLEGLDDLQVQQTVCRANNPRDCNTWSGISLWGLLNYVGLDTDPAIHNDFLGMYVVATGSDGYKAAFSLGELSPNFGNKPDLIAYQVDGENLTTSGFARVVVPEDIQRGRWVSNLIGLEVFHAAEIPEPPTYALLGLGLLALGWRAGRRAP